MAQRLIEAEVAPPRFRMGYDEWVAWDAQFEGKSEWVDGEVIVFMSTTLVHALVSGFVFMLLKHFADFTGTGQVLAETIEMRFPDRSRVPDILFVARDHLDRLSDRRLIGAADLVVEFVSDDSVQRDRRDKFAEYAAAGVAEYWILDPRTGQQTASFYRLSGDRYVAVAPDADGSYRSAVLPGFWLRPDWLWQEPLPNALTCLAEIAPDALRAALRSAAADA